MVQFAKYEGFNKRKSSTIELIPTSGIIKKVKPARSELKQREEYLSME